jgi:hypothetical protein
MIQNYKNKVIDEETFSAWIKKNFSKVELKDFIAAYESREIYVCECCD